jgi:broad specificity phosphatase PhoE
LSWAEAEARDPDVARRKAEDWLAVPPPGGEIWSEFLERVAGALERVRCGPMPAALVAHMTVNSAVAWWLRRADPVTYRQSYGEIPTYEL